MFERTRDRAKKFLYKPELDFSRTSGKIKKTDLPGPASYKNAQAKDRSASQRRSIEMVVPKAAKMNFISKCNYCPN